MKKNTNKIPSAPIRTHGGAIASRLSHETKLRSSVLANLLWEDEAYEDGTSIAVRIADLIPKVKPQIVADIAIEAREDMNLRHVPLLIVREMVRHPEHKKLVAATLARIVQRPDELAEFMAIYWSEGKTPIANQVKKGLAAALSKFNEYSLAKYRGEGKNVTLRDVMFLVHAKPVESSGRNTKKHRKAGTATFNTKSEKLYHAIAENTLKTPDTWEVALSGGADKKETFERLMEDKKLGALAFIRNLRNMEQAGVSKTIIRKYAETVNAERVLPFRYLSAANAAPMYSDIIETLMLRSARALPKLSGKTVLILDTSGSMNEYISGKSDLTRLDTAFALGILAREMCEDVEIYVTSGDDGRRLHATAKVVPYHGFALREKMKDAGAKNGWGGIFLKQVMDYVFQQEKTADRVIILTDEQDCDIKANPDSANAFGTHNYIINVASYGREIAHKKFHHINGWSESVLDYIRAVEQFQNQ